jgi:putative hemolysin
VAGYLLAALGHLPESGESAEVDGRKLTVTQLDGRRISRVLVSPAAPAEDEEPGATATAN